MKINARKEVSLFKRASNKTGGEGRPQTSTKDVTEIKDLLNPVEFLRDENNYDSDRIDITENIFQPDLSVCEKIHLRKQEADQECSVLTTVVEGHIPAARQQSKDDKPAVSQDSITFMNLKVNKTGNKTQMNYNIEAITPKKQKNAPSCSAKSNNYVNTLVNFTKNLKEKEHQKQLEILEVELNIQKVKLKSAILEREILELGRRKSFCKFY